MQSRAAFLSWATKDHAEKEALTEGSLVVVKKIEEKLSNEVEPTEALQEIVREFGQFTR